MFRFEERDSDIYNFRAGLDIVIFGCGTRQVDYKLYILIQIATVLSG